MSPARLGRRRALGMMAGSALIAVTTPSRNLYAAEIDDLIARIVGASTLRDGRIRLTIPVLADSGFSVPVSIEVDSPMTANDFVKSIHLIAPRNPRPLVASVTLNTLMARASWSTRMRLAGTQQVAAIALLSDGSYRMARTEVVVSVSACIDGT